MKRYRTEEASPVPQKLVKPDDELFLIGRYVASFDVRPQVVQPSQPATLATSLQPCTKRISILKSDETSFP